MSKMRETLIETPAGTVLFQDFRHHRKKPFPGYHFGEKFVGQFCRCAAESLLWRYATFENDEWYKCDTLRYYHYDQAGERAGTLAGHSPLQEHPSRLQPLYAVVRHRRVPVQSINGFYWVSTKAQPEGVRGFSV